MSLFTPYNVGQPQPEEQTAVGQEQQFQPTWDNKQTRDAIKRYNSSPEFFTEYDLNNIRQHAAHHNVPFYEGEFDLVDALAQAGAGFFEGFTTLNLMEPADNEYEQIFRNLGHLAGFAPGIMATPFNFGAKLTGSVGLSKLAKTAAALNDKSVPMAGAKFLTTKAKEIAKPVFKIASTGHAGAAGDAMSFLTGNQARHIMEGAFHLGAASAISSWQGGVDEMMHSFIHGAQAGAVFRSIGNLALTGSETSNKVIRGVAGSLFMGLPATMRGATTPEQIYEYVMGAYFGKSERPWTEKGARKMLGKMEELAKTNPEMREKMLPELHPDFPELPPEVQKLTKEYATNGIPGTDFKGYGTPEERALMNMMFGNEIKPKNLEDIPAEVGGYEVEQVIGAAGEPVLRYKKGFLDRFVSRMVSGGAEGADRAWANAATKLGIPVFNFTFNRHLAQAMLNKGLPRKLNEAELERANTEVAKSSESLNRPIENMSEYVYNLQRRNWHIVNAAEAVYAVGPILRDGALRMKAVDGGTGWGVDMAIRNKKDVYVFDNSSKKKHVGTTNKWYKYSRTLGRFEEIIEPPKPPKNWGGIGSREISKTGENAIESFLNKHFKGVKIAPTEKEVEEIKSAKKKGETLIEETIENTKKRIKDVEETIELGEAELTDIAFGEQIAKVKEKSIERIKLETDISDLYLELGQLEKELKIYTGTRDISFVDIVDGKVVQAKPFVEVSNTGDTSPGITMSPTPTAVGFAKQHLSSMYDTHLTPTFRRSEIAGQLVFKMAELSDLSRVDKINRSDELVKWVEGYAKKNGTDIKLNTEAQGQLRQWMARQIFDAQVEYIGIKDGEVRFLAKRGKDDTISVPFTGAGVSKRNYEPLKLLQEVYTKAGGKSLRPLGIADHITIKNKDGRYIDMELMRYQDKLETEYRFQGKSVELARVLAQADFNELKANLYKKLNDKDYYTYGGRGDSDRMYFVKYHPGTNDALSGGLLKEVQRIGNMSNEANQMLKRFQKTYKNKGGLDSKMLKVIHDKAYMSNILYEMALNGFDVSTPQAIKKNAQNMFAKGSDFISNSKAFNKRSQIWFTNGYAGESQFIKNYKTEKGNKVKVNADGKARYILAEDLPKSIRDKMDKDPLYSSNIKRKSTELGEHIDGAIITENRTLRALNADAGMPEHHVQNKSFIVSPNAQYGALLGKYMMHDAGNAMSKYMRDAGINFIIQSSAAKQIGLRKMGDYKVTKTKGLDLLGSEIYDLDFSHIKYNYSVKTDAHMTKWTRAVKQMMGALLDNSKTPFKTETIRDMLNTLMDNRFVGEAKANQKYAEYLKLNESSKRQKINDVMKDIDNLGIEQMIEGIRRPGNNLFAERLYEYMLSKNKEILEADYREGQITEAEYQNSMFEINAENVAYQKKLRASKEWKKLNPDAAKNSVDAMLFDKDVRDYRMQVIRNFIVREATRPIMANSAIARMRPYDKAMQMDLDNANPRLKELNNNDKIYFLDNGFKQMKIDTGIPGYGKKGIVTLGELWEGRKGTYKDVAPEIFETLALRVPMDSVSGAHGLTFRGFTGREGYGTLLHSRTMRALGGADLDGDEAHIYFGGEKKGFKKAWREGFEANKEEFYYTKNNQRYVGDNKMSEIPKELIKELGLAPNIKTYQDLLTTTKEFQPAERKLLNSRGAMYSLHERNRISEAASRGRAQMGASAVVPKQMMQQLHSMLGGGDGDIPLTSDKFTISRRGKWNNVLKKYNFTEYEVIITPRTQDKWRKLAQEIGRAQVAFSSDPMDELGLKSPDFWFKTLHNAHFEVQILNKKTKQKAKALTLNDLTAWDLKKGLYGTINSLNKAYWGKNYQEGRRWTMDEIRSMSEAVYDLPLNQRNSFLAKVGELLNPLDWSDNAIGRMDATAVLDMYKRVNKDMASKRFNFLKDLLGRSSFAVPESKELVKAIFTIDNSKTFTNNGKTIEVGFDLWNPKRRREIARDDAVYAEAVKGLTIPYKLLNATKSGKKEDIIAARERVLAKIALRAEDYFLNDINDMATFKVITDLARNMSQAELQIIPKLHKFAESIKDKSYLMASQRKNIHNVDWNSFTPEMQSEVRKWLKDNKLKHFIPEEWKTTKEKISSTIDRAEIDVAIRKFRKDNKLSKKQAEMLDYLLLGTYKRGNLTKIRDLENQLGADDPVMRDMISYMKSMAAGTATSKLGWNSEALSTSKSMLNYAGAITQFFSEPWKAPTTEQISRAQNAAENIRETVKKETKIDYFEESVVPETIERTTGFEGLKEGVEIRNVSPELREPVTKLLSYIKGENNKFQNEFNQVVRSLLGKDINVLNKNDYNILNRWFKDVKTGTIWQQIWGKDGPTDLAKRHYWLFPKTINRELMKDDIRLMEENGLYLAQGGRILTGKVMRPTQYVDMVQRWIARTMDGASETADAYVKLLKENLLFVNSVKEGEVLRQIAVREREFRGWDSMKQLSVEDRIHKTEYRDRYNEIIKHHGDKLNQTFNVQIDGKNREMTGRQIVDRINKKYTEYFEEMHNFIRGEENWLEKNKMVKGYYGGDKKSPIIDNHRFSKFLLDSWRKGENVTTKIGVDNLRVLARSLMIDMAKGTPEYAEALKSRPIEPTGKWRGSFDYYFPHMHFNKKLAGEGMKRLMKKIYETPLSEFDADPKKARAKRDKEVKKVIYKNHTLTGDWQFKEVEDWANHDRIMNEIAESRAKKKEKVKWPVDLTKAGNMNSRISHIPGWSIDASAPEAYARAIVNTYYRQLAQILSRNIMQEMYGKMKPIWGEKQAIAWQKFMQLYVQDAIGNPTVIPESYVNDPTMKLRGTPYAWWADSNVEKRINKALDAFGLTKKDLPKEMRGIDMQQLRHWSNLEGQFEMAALLAHPKSAITNVFGGTIHTAQSAGWTNLRNARNIDWLRQNINSEWKSMEDVMQFVVESGVYPEYMIYEAGLNKEIRQGKNRAFIEDVAKKLANRPEMSETSLKEIAKQYNVKDKVVQFAAKFMTVPERMIRRDSFMAHYIQAWQRYGGAIKDPKHPFLIEQAKKGVQATQFLYSAPFRPAFARTALGKVMTRFQLWSWNSVRFRNDVWRQAKIYGLRPGSEEFERYVRTMQTDIFTFALANMFAYSIFETALPAPWNWMQDTADWVFGNEKERDRAFFGQWPKQLAPLQMVTPPILRLLPTSMRAMVDDDWSKISKYYVWTMFPFGRVTRDLVGPGNLIDNPIRIMEKTSGFPLLQLQRKGTQLKAELESGEREMPPTPGSGLSPFGFDDE